jgi:hypothetical protein
MENKSERQARKWLIEEMGLREEDIVKNKGTPDFLTPIGGFEVKKLYRNKIIFYSDQLDILARYPDVKILIFNGDGHLVKEASYSDIDTEHSMLGDIEVVDSQMTSIQISKDLRKRLQSLGKMGDTYDDVLQRLLNGINPGRKGEPHEDRGVKTNESTGNCHQQAGQERR